MAFDRTERFVKLTASTPARIGPGTYDISDPSKPMRDPDNAYPFLSGARRQTLGIPKDVHKFPDPGSYNIEGGSSIDYTDVRFKEKTYEGPNLTEYTLPDDLFKVTRKIRSHPGTWRGHPGNLWLIRPPRPFTTGLSVPSKRDVGGYDYNNEYSIFVKNPIIEPKPIDFYDVPCGETNLTTLRYKGNFWSRMKGHRDDERISVTPGPGEYEHETKKSPAQIHHERTREAKRAVVKQPRFLEALYQQKLRENFPAPNHYDLPKSMFEGHEHILCKCDFFTVSPPAFNQTAKRFEDIFQSDTPGPGTYEIAPRQICYGSILPAPFGAYSARFKRIVDTVTPGPANYHTDVGNLAFESAKRFKGKHGETFDYRRLYKMLTSISEDDEHILTNEREITDERKCPVYHAVFKSTVERFPKIRKDDDVPDLGAYEALSAFKANRDRCDFLCRRLTPPFGSRASRFPKIPEINFHVPGPAHYDLRGDILKNAKNGVICCAPREKKVDEGPGPFDYHIAAKINTLKDGNGRWQKTFTEL